MPEISIDEFRASLKVSSDEALGCGEQVYSYWNNQSASPAHCDREEVLHVMREADGSFYLEIGNILHRGPLAELEEKLFEWARDEGWFT